MCGLTGFYAHNCDRGVNLDQVIWNMTNSLEHRGPDDSGTWRDGEFDLLLGHRRLSILDLSEAGHQPMHSACKRYVILLNGEIYNHIDLRNELDSQVDWRGNSDTETLVNCFVEWGVEHTLVKLEGMFSIALWDLKEKELTLMRDPFGEKPLYYGWQGDNLFFGSELKALKLNPLFQNQIDRNSLALFFRHNCIPAPYSIYKGIKKLMPGSYLTFDLKNINKAKQSEIVNYWNLNTEIEISKKSMLTESLEQSVEKIEYFLNKSVVQQMISDVPLGAFLSGGIDSSAIVSLMQKNSMSAVKTFSIGFNESEYDEAVYAKDVANHLGTDHTELYVRPEEAMEVIPSLSSIYCEPFSDSSQIPTYLVSKLASDAVTVCLSGDGGDEIFGGYNRYLEGQATWSALNRLPKSVRNLSGSFLTSLSPTTWDQLFMYVKYLIPRKYRFSTPGDKAHKLAIVLYQNSLIGFYSSLCSHWQEPESLVIGSKEYLTNITQQDRWINSDNFIEKMMAMDASTYLTDDILVKVDRAAMACSLESRIPILNKDLVRAAWTLPLNHKIHDGVGKWPLRQILYKYVPEELIERPKHGFGIPVGEWLRGPLKEWASDILNTESLNNSGYLNSEPIIELWKEHIEGKCNHQHQLWDVLMFESWLKTETT
jgi:asparagine synthase (glutamine-hydrolysing)